MDFATIEKNASALRPRPNLTNYRATRRVFSYEAVRRELGWQPGGDFNIAFLALERQIDRGLGDKLALRWLGRDGSQRDFTYAALDAEANRFANLLRGLGVGRGERVFALAHRTPALYAAALGTLKAGAVFCPLFSQFGPEPIRARMEIGDAALLLTSETLYRRKVEPWRRELPGLRHVLLTDAEADASTGAGATIALAPALAAQPDAFACADTGPEDMALLHFTSGTTGKPKGVIHVHDAATHHYATGRFALDLHADDVFWCTADPGWVTGTSYGILAPLLHGVTMIVDEAEFEAERWYGILQDQKVTVWYTAPTAIRMLMRLGAEVAAGYDLSALRFPASVGEPLNPEAVVWGKEVLGTPFHDNWWQTETGGIMIANFAALPVRPGSMGLPLPGIEAGIVERGEDGSVTEIAEPDRPGELALRPGWPSMMRGYLHEEARYEKAFAGGWYLTGDLARRDADGYYWFVGRADDMIKTSGHLIGPFEVESALMEHPAVSEAAVIGLPDPVAGEVVKAFVALKPGFAAGDALAKELLGHARKRLGAAVAPREIAFRSDLPKTRSGKILRRLLKARELGLEAGDTSTLESDEKR
ncbi:acetyl-CoA synthetase [Tistlia consotensis]|uniref:acetate--CoA ligase n=1 Tax=Tistlia consotensis USBA 355 TaxID=560819 RepID=A0A1Y6CPH7_9PROT|nr:acetate--CoA ligase [Tistlia consotensis]SMF81017.1 acetyl-CoA synthetase [Tistlia consotensis USBA 355]SNS22348.1 acetyl-CoA synthetase [Tistlia consotensis]